MPSLEPPRSDAGVGVGILRGLVVSPQISRIHADSKYSKNDSPKKKDSTWIQNDGQIADTLSKKSLIHEICSCFWIQNYGGFENIAKRNL